LVTVGKWQVLQEGRTSEHCTDTARSIGVPVIHVNADDVEALVRAMTVAAEWRARWQRDIIIDVCGYRCADKLSVCCLV
jgi:2-oxoglutarate dehydrogenase E1 component